MVPSATPWGCILPFAQLVVLLFSLFFVPTASRLVNITVDDTLGDPHTGLFPVYLPTQPATWHIGSLNETCPPCKIQPYTLDLNQIYQQTWHDATYTPSDTPATITVSFSGSAVYVFNIVPNTLSRTTTVANISFTMDGEYVGSFIRDPDPSSDILYKHLVYSNTTLQDDLHTLVMSAGGGSSESFILFDYLLYTTTESNCPISLPPPNDRPHAQVGAIVGAVVGGIALALLGVVIAVSCLRIRRRTRPQPTLKVKRISLTPGGYGDAPDGLTGSGPGVYRGRGSGMSGGHFAPPMIPIAPFFPHMMRAPNRSATHSPFHLDSVDYGPDAAAPDVDPTSTSEWSSKRRVELSRRLVALNRRMSFLSSSTGPSRSEASGGSGIATEIQELQAEIAQLRSILARRSERVAGEHGRDPDPLPVYTAQ